jgi:hypothetical protein
MGLFQDVFNPKTIEDMLFFNIKAVLIYPTFKEFAEKNPQMFERWKYLSKTKYNANYESTQPADDAFLQKTYEDNAVQHPEFCKILAITYATTYVEAGVLKRNIKKIAGDNEVENIDRFMDVLKAISGDGTKSTPQYFPILCGHNIIAYEIPLLIKRYMFHRNAVTIKHIPLILKNALNVKPWESGIIDTVNVWKFNGFEYSPLMLASDFLGLKKSVDLVAHNELSRTYWQIVATEPQKALDFVSLQSATQTNLVIQLMNEFRQV